MTGGPDSRLKAIFLDRDGVLNKVVMRNEVPCPPPDLDALDIYEDAPRALGGLREAGFRLVVVTNQPDVVRGTTPLSTVAAINATLARALPLDSIEMCLHDDAAQCGCRKPQPGMLVNASLRDGIDLSRSYMIGDRWRDVEAGKRAGCTTILLGGGYSEGLKSPPHASVSSLTAAAEWILQREKALGES